MIDGLRPPDVLKTSLWHGFILLNFTLSHFLDDLFCSMNRF